MILPARNQSPLVAELLVYLLFVLAVVVWWRHEVVTELSQVGGQELSYLDW